MRRVYIETSVVGAYFDMRDDLASAAQRQWTRRWWSEERPKYDAVCSEAVVDELSHPDYPHSADAVELIDNLPRLPIEAVIIEIARVYIDKRLMPRDPVGDALHLAVCSFHRCDFLLTWNCGHLANPNKFERIRIINAALGLFVPSLVTPNQLIGVNDG